MSGFDSHFWAFTIGLVVGILFAAFCIFVQSRITSPSVPREAKAPPRRGVLRGHLNGVGVHAEVFEVERAAGMSYVNATKVHGVTGLDESDINQIFGGWHPDGRVTWLTTDLHGAPEGSNVIERKPNAVTKEEEANP